MLYCRSDETKVKRNMISSIPNLVYELLQGLPHDLPSNLRVRILGNKEILGKSQILVET